MFGPQCCYSLLSSSTVRWFCTGPSVAKNPFFFFQIEYLYRLSLCTVIPFRRLNVDYMLSPFQLRFYYHMKGLWFLNAIGSLRIRLRNTITRDVSLPIWQRSGHQGNLWIRANVPINTTWPVTQVCLLLCGTRGKGLMFFVYFGLIKRWGLLQ